MKRGKVEAMSMILKWISSIGSLIFQTLATWTSTVKVALAQTHCYTSNTSNQPEVNQIKYSKGNNTIF